NMEHSIARLAVLPQVDVVDLRGGSPATRKVDLEVLPFTGCGWPPLDVEERVGAAAPRPQLDAVHASSRKSIHPDPCSDLGGGIDRQFRSRVVDPQPVGIAIV